MKASFPSPHPFLPSARVVHERFYQTYKMHSSIFLPLDPGKFSRDGGYTLLEEDDESSSLTSVPRVEDGWMGLGLRPENMINASNLTMGNWKGRSKWTDQNSSSNNNTRLGKPCILDAFSKG